ncbi:MAG: hypothetical protein VYD48_03050 [Bacteroidota bacterium]|nr:hypothetical protein [Bacteroidota bacterium]
MKDYIIPISILISSLIIGFAILGSSQAQRFDHIDKNVVFDKKTGTTYYTDKKQYLDKKGDRYQYD